MYDHFAYLTYGREHQEKLLAEAQRRRLLWVLGQSQRRKNGFYRVLRIHTGRSLIAAGQYLLKRTEAPPVHVTLPNYANLR